MSADTIGEPEKPDTKPCRYCGAAIPTEASICATCKCDQSPWKNNITIFGGLTGLITFVLSALSFMWVNSLDIIEKMNWEKKVEVRYFRTQLLPEFDAGFSNSGNEPAFIDEISVIYRGRYARYRVSRQVEPKQFLSVENIEKKINSEYSTFISKDFARTPTGQITPEILNNFDYMIKGSTNRESKCFTPVFFLANEADIRRISGDTASGEVVAEPAEGHMIYYRLTTGEKAEAKFPAVATFVRSTSPGCSSL